MKGTDETSINAGARNIARDCIANLLHAKHGNPPRLERAVVDGVDSIRLAPPATAADKVVDLMAALEASFAAAKAARARQTEAK